MPEPLSPSADPTSALPHRGDVTAQQRESLVHPTLADLRRAERRLSSTDEMPQLGPSLVRLRERRAGPSAHQQLCADIALAITQC